MHVAAVAALVLLAACTAEEAVPVSTAPRLGHATYEKFLVRADTGDAAAQNLVGFMLYFGEGVPQDRVEAHYWFHRAADQGHRVSQLNLAIMHALGEDAVADPAEAGRYYSQAMSLSAKDGASVAEGMPPQSLVNAVSVRRAGEDARISAGRADYETYCAGCHGLNGVARYVASPSFAIGERMDKPDERLLDSIANGRGMMPSWREKLGDEQRRRILAYVRTLKGRFEMGIALTLRESPERYFTFGPMQGRPFDQSGETDGTALQPVD